MTRLTQRIGMTLAAITAISFTTACGSAGTLGILSASNLDMATASKNIQGFSRFGNLPEGFDLNGLSEGDFPGGFGMRDKAGHMSFAAELNLTDEQKTALKALKPEGKTNVSPPNPENREKANAIVNAAFLSETFDAAALKTELEGLKPDHSSDLKQKAENMIKFYQILTPEQHAAMEAKASERESKMSEQKRPERPEHSGMADKRITMLTEKLGLNAEQVTAFKALEEDKPDFESQKSAQKATRDAIQAELKSESPSADKIVSILEEARPDRNPLDKLADIYAILTPEQRQTWVTLQEQKPEGKPGFGKKGPHQGGGHGPKPGRGHR